MSGTPLLDARRQMHDEVSPKHLATLAAILEADRRLLLCCSERATRLDRRVTKLIDDMHDLAERMEARCATCRRPRVTVTKRQQPRTP